MQIDNAAVVALFVWQALQTVQLVAVSRGMAKVSKTLMPPPPMRSRAQQQSLPPLAAYCQNCGNLTAAGAELRGGGVLCPQCLGTSATDPAQLRRR